MTTHDIEGAKPKPETTWTKPNLVNPDDINKDGLFKTTRCTNPIVPTY